VKQYLVKAKVSLGRYSEQARKEGEIRIGYGACLGSLRGMGGAAW